ncbi:hypothetical protein J1N35_022051 [Gossypium stocksii]|uniref:Uncharacterized protein n=1 Tax=Gossypium stocksii TaxID=47602 RepID=A0A9D3VFQ3_9ROSI|nr:hypothetical protein J1N35_022051 [Gossypium stocksii]
MDRSKCNKRMVAIPTYPISIMASVGFIRVNRLDYVILKRMVAWDITLHIPGKVFGLQMGTFKLISVDELEQGLKSWSRLMLGCQGLQI